MIYVDTNVLVSYINPRDSLCDIARDYVLKLKRHKLVISSLTIVELYSVFSRTMNLSDIEIEALVEYTIKSVGVELYEIPWGEVVEKAIEYANKLKLKTLDLLHVVSAKAIGALGILTFDRDIASRVEILKRLLGLEVYSPFAE